MIFVAIMEGKSPLVHAFSDERGGKITVNGDCYLKLLQDRVWPLFRSYATQRNLWWMQDGALPHCTNVANFPEGKITRKSHQQRFALVGKAIIDNKQLCGCQNTGEIKKVIQHRARKVSLQRVISRGTEFVWPAHSPDRNPLDFHFWAAAQKQVYLQKPESIGELVECVKQISLSYDQETIRREAMNVVERARMCLRADGGHS